MGSRFFVMGEVGLTDSQLDAMIIDGPEYNPEILENVAEQVTGLLTQEGAPYNDLDLSVGDRLRKAFNRISFFVPLIVGGKLLPPIIGHFNGTQYWDATALYDNLLTLKPTVEMLHYQPVSLSGYDYRDSPPFFIVWGNVRDSREKVIDPSPRAILLVRQDQDPCKALYYLQDQAYFRLRERRRMH